MLDFPNGTAASALGVMSYLSSSAAFLDELGTASGGLLLATGNPTSLGANVSTLANYSSSAGSLASPAGMVTNASVAPMLTTALLNVNGTGVEFAGGSNLTHSFTNFVHKEFIFDRTDVRVIFITLYSLVFCCCFFGKWLIE
uniref:Uncharacterized protein n=1 Tax=Anopheles dirus TaxID=7168 RepID=A0A182NAL3_9DIPT